ncbi:hypothetical protein PG630_10015 [Riemerella anatipestifer]|nr:hypothetical protein [Riemerella anatipestifer]MDY3317642.1 hypothetical protein [Riemerella anatipestifer]
MLIKKNPMPISFRFYRHQIFKECLVAGMPTINRRERTVNP